MKQALSVFGGFALSAFMLVAPANAQDLMAKADIPHEGTPVSLPQSKPSIPQDPFFVPVKDMNKFRPEVAKTAAAGVSAKGIIVLVTGNDDELLETAKKAAHDAKQEGAHVLGIIDGGGDNNEVMIYLGGVRHNKPGFTSYLDIKDSIMFIEERVPEFVAALGQPQ